MVLASKGKFIETLKRSPRNYITTESALRGGCIPSVLTLPLLWFDHFEVKQHTIRMPTQMPNVWNMFLSLPCHKFKLHVTSGQWFDNHGTLEYKQSINLLWYKSTKRECDTLLLLYVSLLKMERKYIFNFYTAYIWHKYQYCQDVKNKEVIISWPSSWVCFFVFWLVVSTPLKNMLVKLDHFPRYRDENKKCLKPPPSFPLVYIKSCHVLLSSIGLTFLKGARYFFDFFEPRKKKHRPYFPWNAGCFLGDPYDICCIMTT